jgi:hypothetical protein
MNGKPICYESANVRLVDGIREIPYTGALTALLVPTDSAADCAVLGVFIDQRVTLIVDCLHAPEEIDAFHRACRDNAVEATPWGGVKIAAPCPPPENQMQVAGWAAGLFLQLTGGR